MEAVVVIMFSYLIINRVGRDITNPLMFDTVIALSLIGLVTSVLQLIGSILQLIGLVDIETLRSIVTYLATHCPLIAIALAGSILIGNDSRVQLVMIQLWNRLLTTTKKTSGKKIQ